MSNQIKRICFILLLIICNARHIYSQTEQQLLETILTQIEKKYQISFSYTDDTIENRIVNFQYQEEEPLDNLIQRLEQVTDLKFNILNKKFVTISASKEPKQSSSYHQELEEVHIQNYLTSGIAKNTTGGITITPEKTEILPGLIEPDVLQTIQALPGVLSINEDVSNISIRGGTPDQNLVLYDGIKMYQTGHFFGLISAFNPNLIKEISVHRHGAQAKYGDGASSVITMELSDEKSKTFKAGTGFNLLSADGYAVVPLNKKVEVQVAARRAVTDVVETPTYKQYFDRIFQDSDLTNREDAAVSKNENFYFYDLTLKFLYDVSEKDKLRFNFLSIYNALDYEEETTTTTTSSASKSELTQQSLALGLNYRRQWNAKLNTNVQLYYSSYDLKGNNLNILQNQRLQQENSVLDDGIKLGGTYRFSNNFGLDMGFQLAQVSIRNVETLNNPQFSQLTKKVLRTYTSYVEGNYATANKNTTARLGVRHNYLEKFGAHLVEPRLYLSQRLLEHFRIDLSGELKSQTTSQVIDLQQDFLGIEKRRWVVTDNEAIPIIKSKQATVGLAYKQNDLLIRTEAYLKIVKGITTSSQGFQNQYQFVYRVGDYTIKGIDFLINKQFTNLSTWISYSVSKNEYNFEMLNGDVAFPNNFDINHVLNFSATYKLKELKLGIGMNWHSAKPVTNPEEVIPILNNGINYDIPNGSRLPEYLRVDFSSTYEFKFGKSKAQIGASIWNLLNKKNIVNTYYRLDDDRISQIDNRALAITPNLSFRYWF